MNGKFDVNDDREIGDGAVLERSAGLGFDWSVTSDERKKVNGWFYLAPRFLLNGATSFFVDAGVKLQALPQLELELLPSFTYTAGEPRFYDYGENDEYLFGRLEAASLSATLSATYTFLPTLTLQVYGQAFADFGRFTDFTSYPAGDGALRPRIALASLQPAAGWAGVERNFADGALNANVVVRWEYRMGSTVYLVYTHGQGNGGSTWNRERGSFNWRLAEPRPAADVFLLKASYWWG